MDLTHRIPFPPVESYHGIFHNANMGAFYNDLMSKNVQRSSRAAKFFNENIQYLEDIELFAIFNLTRHNMLKNSVSLRKDCLQLLISLCKTVLITDCLPYIFILANDENKQIKIEAGAFFGITTKGVGGIKTFLPKMISSLGSMGALAFSQSDENDAEGIVSKSHIAGSVLLAANNILGVLVNELTHREIVELLQYLKTATSEFSILLNNELDSNQSLFYTQRLRCSLYKLYTQTSSIAKAPCIGFECLVKEKDNHCLKYVSPLFRKICPNLEWKVLLSNSYLLGNLYSDFLIHCNNDEIKQSLFMVEPDNVLKGILYLLQIGDSCVPIEVLLSNTSIWNSIPEDLLFSVIRSASSINASFVIKYPSLFKNLETIEFSSDSDFCDIVNAIVRLAVTDDIPYIITKFPQYIIEVLKLWTISPMTDWWCSDFVLVLKKLIHADILTVKLVVPSQEKCFFMDQVTSSIIDMIRNGNPISPNHWENANITTELCETIISNKTYIDEVVRARYQIYNSVYHHIMLSFVASESGKLVSSMISISQVIPTIIMNDFDFLSSLFESYPITPFPEDSILFYFQEYLDHSFPDLTLLAYLGMFDKSFVIPMIHCYFSTKQSSEVILLYEKALSLGLHNVCLMILLLSSQPLQFPFDIGFYPLIYNIRNDIEFKGIDNLDPKDEGFLKFIKGYGYPKEIYSDSYQHVLFIISQESGLNIDFIQIDRLYFPTYSSLDFYLILKSLLLYKPDFPVFETVFIHLLSSLEILPPLIPETCSLLTEIFILFRQFSIKDIFDLIEQILPLLFDKVGSKVLSCFEESLPFLIESLPSNEWKSLRDVLSKGQINTIFVFDTCLFREFEKFKGDCNNLGELFFKFPQSGSRWISSFPDSIDNLTKEYLVSEISKRLLSKIFNIVQDFRQDGLIIAIKDREILCKSSFSDEPFMLRIQFPKNFPLEPPFFEISSMGKEKITQNCIDEVKRESIRSSGITHSINTWFTRVSTIISQEDPCPICLSLLDHTGSLPKTKCSICHKACHLTCISIWVTHSLRKDCPWCRSKWKRYKN